MRCRESIIGCSTSRSSKRAEAEAQKARDLRLDLREAHELLDIEVKAGQEKALLKAAREHELKMACSGKHPTLDRASAFDPSRNIRLVPPPLSKKRRLMSILLILGKLLIVYEHVKEAILKDYEIVPKAYRQKFRNYLKYDSKTYVDFARENENLFNRLCHSKDVGQDFEKLKQMVLLEEFKGKVWPDIRSHLDEQKVEELEKPAVMTDDYALTHKMIKSGNPQQKRYYGSGNGEKIS